MTKIQLQAIVTIYSLSLVIILSLQSGGMMIKEEIQKDSKGLKNKMNKKRMTRIQEQILYDNYGYPHLRSIVGFFSSEIWQDKPQVQIQR